MPVAWKLRSKPQGLPAAPQICSRSPLPRPRKHGKHKALCARWLAVTHTRLAHRQADHSAETISTEYPKASRTGRFLLSAKKPPGRLEEESPPAARKGALASQPRADGLATLRQSKIVSLRRSYRARMQSCPRLHIPIKRSTPSPTAVSRDKKL